MNEDQKASVEATAPKITVTKEQFDKEVFNAIKSGMARAKSELPLARDQDGRIGMELAAQLASTNAIQYLRETLFPEPKKETCDTKSSS